MGKYDFIKTGNLLYWHDPDNGLSDGAYRVISAPENMEDDSIIPVSYTHLKEFGQNFIVAVLSVREIWTIENRESC